MSPRLEFDRDERSDTDEEPRRRGSGVRVALLSLAVAGLVGGSWWAGHSGKPAAQDVSAVPEIHPDAAPVKEAPKDRGGMVVPGQDSTLLNREAKGKPEELLPPPEAVKPRPAPPTPPPQVAAAPAQAPAASAAPTAPPSAAAAPAIAQPPAPQIAATPAPPPAVASPAAKAQPTPASTGAGYRLQLGALKTEEAAKAEWQKLQRQNSDVLGRLSLSVSRVDLGAKGIYYRIQAGPVADAGQAAQDCAALKSRSVGCILVKP